MLAQEVQLAGEAAEEARRNREAREAAAAKATGSGQSFAGDFVGEKQVPEGGGCWNHRALSGGDEMPKSHGILCNF